MDTQSKDGWETKPNYWETETEEMKYTIHQSSENNDDLKKPDYSKRLIDAIFVLAGGLTDNGKLHEWVIRRLNLALKLHKNSVNREKQKIICLGGGTYHKPPYLNEQRYVIHESTACAEYLIKSGIDPKNIYREWSSYDTIANGYFAFSNYILPLNLKNIIVITSEFHIDRTKQIFNWILKLNNINCKIYYECVTDEGLPKDILNCRREREKNSLMNLKNNVIPKINTINKFVKWFYEDHKAYCSDVYILKDKNDDDNNLLKKTY